MDLDDIPGLKRAVARARAKEESIRERAFWPCCLRICWIDVNPLTPRHFILLTAAQSPLIGYAGPVLPEHVSQFLWIVSTAFVLPTHQVPLREVKKIRAAFDHRVQRVQYFPARKQIKAYIDEAWFDAPVANHTSEEPAHASLAAALIERFSPMPPATFDVRGQPVLGGGTLDTPFSQLFQLLRMMQRRDDPDCFLRNPLSDRVERECVRRYFERKKARKAARQAKAAAARAALAEATSQASGNRQPGEGKS